MATNEFIPGKFQPQLALKELIQPNDQTNQEQVPMDVLFVGAGPAGLAGAIELARLVKADNENGGNIGNIEIGVLEKAESLGGHSLSGAVINPRALMELFPQMRVEDFPFRGRVNGDQVYYLTETAKFRIPTPPTMHNKNNYVASICEVVRWLGQKAEEAGVNIFTSFPADKLLVEEDRVVGVRTAAAGLNRDGEPGGQFLPPTDVMAKVTVLSEGTRGTLTQAFCQWQNISSPRPQIYALGVKELWRSKKVPQHVIHTLGWPLPQNVFGGSFMYPMGEDLVALGLVAGLDYKQHNLDVHVLLQQMKRHPLFKEFLAGGEICEWGAKTIPEGGLLALPDRLHGNGIMIAGDAAGFVNVPALKGIHYAMQSGIFAARTAFAALKANDVSAQQLSQYDQLINSSYIYDDLKKVKNMRHAFKGGFYSGVLKAGLMTLTAGHCPPAGGHFPEDSNEPRAFMGPASANPGLAKVDAVYLAGNKTRDDIPQHLHVGKDISPEVAEFYVHMCPAGVYERNGDQLIVNAPNCIDCKATDILGPRWRPREGGSGPQYKLM